METKTLDHPQTLSDAQQELLTLLLAEEGFAVSPTQAIKPRTTDAEPPLSFAQQRLWILEQLEPELSAYVVPLAVRFSGALNTDALRASLDEIVRRHEILRTTFVNRQGRAVQLIAPAVSRPLPLVDVSHHPADEREGRVRELLRAEAMQPFDLSGESLLRSTLLRLDVDEHVLLLTMHHAIFDGSSMPILISELAAIYAAFAEGKPSPLPPLPIQYADFAVWEQDATQRERLQEHLAYWKEQLANLPALELPTDRPRPFAQSFRGATASVKLSAKLTTQLKALSQKQNATLFMTLLAAFDALLYRWTGQTDIPVGIPVANRHRAEIQNLIGFFVNTLVLRTDLSANPDFRQLLKQVRERALAAYPHQELPFEKLVEELQPERHLSHTPLFQVMFQLLDAPLPPAELAGMKLRLFEVETSTAKFDFTLTAVDEADGLSVVLEYSTDLFDADTARRMLEHFRILLEGVAANPDMPVASLPLVTATERERLLLQWNETKADYPRLCLQQLFESQVERNPQAIALVCDEEQVTYENLNRRANQVAHHLRGLGVEADARVGICVERSCEMVVGILGILKAGGAYLPLDPNYPSERLSFMLEDAGVSVVVAQEKFIAALPDSEATVVCLDTGWPFIAVESEENLPVETTLDHLSYINYTSGSTGQPKGVEVCHRSVLRLLHGVDYVQLDGAQTLLHLSPISFDASTFELWGALLHGGRCVLFPNQIPAAADLSNIIRKNGVDTMWLTASLFNSVINESPQALAGVKQLLIGGEALSVPHVRQAYQALPDIQIINGYGPTENTTFTCCYQIPREIDGRLTSIPLGHPISNTQVYLLDQRLQLVPTGVAGELYTGGDGLARGYLHQPELTAERFIPHPFSTEPGARLYRTGDVARYRADGAIEFLGRADEQVKIRGFRIEPGEIEAVLAEHDEVRQAVVLARAERGGSEKRLVAYVVMEGDGEGASTELRSYLRERLPVYMVPSAYVVLTEMPLTPNGKVDRKALLAFESRQPASDDSYVAPRNTVEETMANIWADVLEVERVGIHDNFFDLGGHSLLATQIMSRLRDALQVELQLRSLFESPTIAELAQAIEQSRREQHDTSIQRINAIDQRNADQLLGQLDELPDEEVAALLNNAFGSSQEDF